MYYNGETLTLSIYKICINHEISSDASSDASSTIILAIYYSMLSFLMGFETIVLSLFSGQMSVKCGEFKVHRFEFIMAAKSEIGLLATSILV